MGTVHVLDKIKIHLYNREHNPPHIHASFAEYEAQIVISTGEILRGALPKRQLKIVLTWLNSEGVKEKLTKMFQNFNPHLRG